MNPSLSKWCCLTGQEWEKTDIISCLLGTSPGPGGRGGQSVQRDQRSELKYFNVCLKQINSDFAFVMIERAKGAGKKNLSLVRYPGTGHPLDLPHSPASSVFGHPLLPPQPQPHALAQIQAWRATKKFFKDNLTLTHYLSLAISCPASVQ